MLDFLIVVNGVPGAGKTALAAPLARALHVPLVAKDAIKEALFDAVDGAAPRGPIGVLASETQWTIAGVMTGTLILESSYAAGRDEPHVERGLDALGRPRGVEVWCEVPLELAFERYTTRPRHRVHADAGRLDEWWARAAAAQPITGLPVIRVDTAREVDVAALATRVRDLRDADASR